MTRTKKNETVILHIGRRSCARSFITFFRRAFGGVPVRFVASSSSDAAGLGFDQDTFSRVVQSSTGRLLCFLRSDHILQPGAIAALLATFRSFPEAGAVVPRAVDADGAVYDAGGVLFRDGETARFGAGWRPTPPHAAHVDAATGGGGGGGGGEGGASNSEGGSSTMALTDLQEALYLRHVRDVDFGSCTFCSNQNNSPRVDRILPSFLPYA